MGMQPVEENVRALEEANAELHAEIARLYSQ
ncbi:hypothetical protein BH10ACI4_BH10ACI4_33310 [soil metagenome]